MVVYHLKKMEFMMLQKSIWIQPMHNYMDFLIIIKYYILTNLGKNAFKLRFNTRHS